MQEILNRWNALPKTVKVFVYLAVSALLGQLSIDLGLIAENSLLAKYALIPINIAIVLLQETAPAVKSRLTK